MKDPINLKEIKIFQIKKNKNQLKKYLIKKKFKLKIKFF